MNANRIFDPGGEHPGSGGVLYIVGELDVASATDLRESLRGEFAHSERPVIIDCSRLTFIDAAGLGVLVWAANQARNLRRTLVLRNRSPAFDKVLRLTGIGCRFATLAPRGSGPPLEALIA